LADVLDVLAGSPLQPRSSEPVPLDEPLSESELRVLGYLPSNLSAPEIAAELFVSTSTVKTHMRQIYAKFEVHKRTDAVQRARDLGLLGPSSRAPRSTVR
ncbi:MAG TPA: LuxR C-terminal-related transcriptional regulator, partial [Chloroflexota bacterium]|nr:LuxR C-terminal-related transcriptional regulator [Chloroflexota bacterium]